MNTPLAKRRRIDGITGANKPFRSPLKTARPPPTPGTKYCNTPPVRRSQLSQPWDEQHNHTLPSPASTQLTTHQHPASHSDPTPNPPREIPDSDESDTDILLPLSSSQPTPDTPSQTRKTPPREPTMTSPHRATRPSARELNEIKALEAEIALLQSHPALVTRPDSDPAALTRLTAKWTRAAREAAELLLPVMRERQGQDRGRGSGAGRSRGWEGSAEKEEAWREALGVREGMLADGVGDGGEVMGSVERDRVQGEVGDLKRMIAENGGERDEEDEDQAEGGWGMGELLRSLGLGMEVLGWHEAEGEWRD